MPSLFDPIALGAIEAPNRILMAPLTRARASREHVPTPLMAEYYAQRASAGLIISEATGISRSGFGWPYAPGIWTAEMIDGWRGVTDAVHAAGGRIVVQLWHMGRVAHSSFIGHPPLSASATQAPGLAHTYAGRQPFDVARAMTVEEIAQAVADFGQGAANAIEAGFDGVQLHAANGYMIDQFLRDGSNLRDDAYGGSIENRTRLLREACTSVIDRVGAGRLGIRLSPNEPIQGVDDSDPQALFPYIADFLSDMGIGFLEIREPKPDGTYTTPKHPALTPAIRAAFAGPLVLNSDFSAESAAAALAAGEGDAVSFGRPFIGTPDLPHRIANGLPFVEERLETRYTQGREGYADYPAAEENIVA